MAQPTITLPTGSGVNTPSSVSTLIDAALAAETAYVETLGLSALAPGIDDPNNVQGLGAPAIIRGTIHAHLVSGVTTGAGQTQAVQIATFNALTAALRDAGTLGKFFEIEPNIYEIYGALGLVMPYASPCYWKGTTNSIITQYYPNAPALVIGDQTNPNNTCYGAKIDGVCAQYGVNQTGQTNANLIAMGSMAWCRIENLATSSITGGAFPITYPAYISVRILPGGIWFNNCLRNIRLYGGQQSLFTQESQGSGNLIQDMYVSNGTNNNASESVYAALSGPAIFIGNTSYATMSGNVYERINIESVKCQAIMTLQEAQSFTFIGLHFENLEINASNGGLIQNNGSNGQIIGMDTYDIQVPSGLTNIAVLQNSGSGEMVIIDGLRMGWSGYSNPGLQSPMTVLNTQGNNDQNVTIKMKGLVIGETTANNTPYLTLWNSNYPLFYNPTITYSTAVGELSSDQVQARTISYQPIIQTATYTHYGAHTDAVLMVPPGLPAACTITLSNKKFPSGIGSSLATTVGNTVRIRRLSGTYTNSLTVKDAAAGTTLTTNTTSAVDYLYQFNGTNWVVAT